MNHTFHLNNLFLSDEFGAEGFSGPGPSHEGSFRSGPPSHDLSPGSSPGISFAPGPGSAPMGPPGTNYNNIQIPPGAHAPANTPAELQPFSGTTQKLNLRARPLQRFDPNRFPLCGLLETSVSPVQEKVFIYNRVLQPEETFTIKPLPAWP